jgi:hypothetical protein
VPQRHAAESTAVEGAAAPHGAAGERARHFWSSGADELSQGRTNRLCLTLRSTYDLSEAEHVPQFEDEKTAVQDTNIAVHLMRNAQEEHIMV